MMDTESTAIDHRQGFKQRLLEDNAGESSRYNVKLYDILERAAVLFARKGYHNTSIRDLASELETSLAGLYYYFETKEELLFLISQYSFDSVTGSLEEKLEETADPREKLKIFVHNHLQYFVTHLEAMKVLAHESDSLSGEYFARIQSKKKSYLKMLENILLEIVRRGDRSSAKLNQDIKIAALSLFGMMNWTYTWFDPYKHGHRAASIRKIADRMVDVFLHGFVKS